ncbi:putative membrane protein YedE/YeeE [Alkalihalobacillus hemicentroti]|uniref:Membrane protein YedE/YeeE n=2 Tax=Guptibacillus hwajinpoensis TaxID=208199 RepID=A0ABU0K1E0_9BACL|nr:putative membrane protein YedE/YeeE [Alkalihalobacillus hemicentroti]
MAMEQPVHTTRSSLQLPFLKAPQKPVLTAGFLFIALLGLILFLNQGVQQVVLFALGLLLGYCLLHARFGFTSAFRQLLSVGNGTAIQSHMLMLAVASTLFAPILSNGFGLFGTTPTGYVFPVGTSVVVGSFLFGIGMQLGGGCASGTLYTVGWGKTEMLLTLFGFIVGSVVGAWHFDFWVNQMPSFQAISLATDTGLGFFGAWVLQLSLFALIFFLVRFIAKKRQPPQIKPLPTANGWKRFFRGSWPIWTAAIALGVLNALTLVSRGNPWGITSAFALWGSKIALFLGIDVTQWGYWSGTKSAALEQSILTDSTSVMNFGVILGAFVAAGAGGAFIMRRVPLKLAAASIIGGLLMGYGARLAFGCNIGAYFGGIASFSLHGWVWMIVALAGSYLALYLRPLFGLKNPKKEDQFC